MTGGRDLAQVKETANFEHILRHFGVKVRGRGKQRMALCPFHAETKPSCSIHVERNVFHCFGCGAKGSVLDFVARIENVSILDAAARTEQICGVRREAPATSRATKDAGKNTHDPNPTRPLQPLPFRLRLDPSHPYLTGRGISPELATTFGLGCCRGESPLQGWICIPIHDEHGALVAYAGPPMTCRVAFRNTSCRADSKRSCATAPRADGLVQRRIVPRAPAVPDDLGRHHHAGVRRDSGPKLAMHWGCRSAPSVRAATHHADSVAVFTVIPPPSPDGKLLWQRREHQTRSSKAIHLPGGSRRFAHHSDGRRGPTCMGKGSSLGTGRSTVGQASGGSHHSRPTSRQAHGASSGVVVWRFQLVVGAVRSTGSDQAAAAGLQLLVRQSRGSVPRSASRPQRQG
jgi:hypothetical protein